MLFVPPILQLLGGLGTSHVEFDIYNSIKILPLETEPSISLGLKLVKVILLLDCICDTVFVTRLGAN